MSKPHTTFREFTVKRYHKIVEKFVKTYLKEGADAAAIWIAGQSIPEADYSLIKDMINLEFYALGYELKLGL